MPETAQSYKRITISLPADISKEVDELKKELKVSKSEIFRKAFEKYIRE